MYRALVSSAIGWCSLSVLTTSCDGPDRHLVQPEDEEIAGAAGQESVKASEGGASGEPADPAGSEAGAGAIAGKVTSTGGTTSSAGTGTAAGGSTGVGGSMSNAGRSAGGTTGTAGTTSATDEELIVTATQQPGNARAASGYLYFSDLAGRVRRVAADSKTIEEVGTATQPPNPTSPPAFAVVGDNIYVASSPSAGAFGIGVVPVAGGTVAPFVPTNAAPTTILADDTSLYYLAQSGGIQRVTIATKQQAPLGIDVSGSSSFAVDAESVYVATSNGTVSKTALNGGAVTPLATGQIGAHALLLDSVNAYWLTAGNDGSVMKVPLDGSAEAEPLSASRTSRPLTLAITATTAYFASNDGSIQGVPLDGSEAPTPIATGQGTPNSIAVDDSRVYWFTAGKLMSAPQ